MITIFADGTDRSWHLYTKAQDENCEVPEEGSNTLVDFKSERCYLFARYEDEWLSNVSETTDRLMSNLNTHDSFYWQFVPDSPYHRKEEPKISNPSESRRIIL